MIISLIFSKVGSDALLSSSPYNTIVNEHLKVYKYSRIYLAGFAFLGLMCNSCILCDICATNLKIVSIKYADC